MYRTYHFIHLPFFQLFVHILLPLEGQTEIDELQGQGILTQE